MQWKLCNAMLSVHPYPDVGRPPVRKMPDLSTRVPRSLATLDAAVAMKLILDVDADTCEPEAPKRGSAARRKGAERGGGLTNASADKKASTERGVNHTQHSG